MNQAQLRILTDEEKEALLAEAEAEEDAEDEEAEDSEPSDE